VRLFLVRNAFPLAVGTVGLGRVSRDAAMIDDETFSVDDVREAAVGAPATDPAPKLVIVYRNRGLSAALVPPALILLSVFALSSMIFLISSGVLIYNTDDCSINYPSNLTIKKVNLFEIV